MTALHLVSDPHRSVGGDSIAHDLRNCLATILGAGDLLVGTGLSEAQAGRLARNIRLAAVRMRDLLEELLDQNPNGVAATVAGEAGSTSA